MHFAQQFELDLRAFLWTADYHGWIPQLPLNEEQQKRFKDSDTFIDKSTCGLLIEAIRSTSNIKDKRVWKAVERACAHRNRLAHSYLAEHNFDYFTEIEEQKALRDLYAMTADLYRALQISRALRACVEDLSDEQHRITKMTMEEFGISDYEAPQRKYVHLRKRPAPKVV